MRGRLWRFATIVPFLLLLLLARCPATLYWLTGSQWEFNEAVSRYVPKGAPLERLEAVVGCGKRVSTPPWLRRLVLREPERFPEGWCQGDFSVVYAFGDTAHWYFQVREGHLVNHDPAVFATQPQEGVAVIR